GQTSITAAVSEYFDNVKDCYDQKVLDAVRQITSPQSRLALRGRLPVMPAAAAKLMRTSAEYTSAIELESIAGSDPVLSGRLLGAANSAQFGSRTEICQLRAAILLLGVPFARKVLLSACFGNLFTTSSTLNDLWKHSRLVAAAAHELAGECGFDQEL